MLLDMFKQNEMLMILNESPYNFHLIRNHFFDGDTYYYDFLATFCPEVIEFLKSLGFYELYQAHDYDDDNTICVMRYYNSDKLHIDIQLVNDANKKNKVQEIIDNNFIEIYNSLDKEKRKKFWDSMYQVYDNFQS